MAKVWFSRWPPIGHKIGQIAKIKKNLGLLPKGIFTPTKSELQGLYGDTQNMLKKALYKIRVNAEEEYIFGNH
jgi:hypothetical protein